MHTITLSSLPLCTVPAVGQVTHDLARMQVQGTAETHYGTLRPAQPFNVEEDTKVLRKAMKGFGKISLRRPDSPIIMYTNFSATARAE